MKLPVIIDNPEAGAIKIPRATLAALLGVPTILPGCDAIEGELKTVGVWQLPQSFRALVESSVWDDSKGYTARTRVTFYGVRTLSNVLQSGHALEGRVSVLGKSGRGFTSSQLFELENGQLVNVATIVACLND